jgi:hypothetical protein
LSKHISGAPLEAREFTYEANPWVLDTLLALHPKLSVGNSIAGRCL